MPPADDIFTILVCECGKRLKAPGATPGRVGRCPSCGGTLRAPGEVPQASPVKKDMRKPSPPRPIPNDARPPRDEPELDEEILPTRVGTKVKTPKNANGAIGREGLVALPKHLDPSLKANLLYPVWDGNGIAMLAFVPPVLWLTSTMSIGLFPSYVIGNDDEVTKFGAMTMIFPMLILLAMTLGYICTFLGEIISLSAFGDLHHPRVPAWQLGPILVNLFRWMWAVAAGLLVSGPLLMFYARGRETIGPKDSLIAAILASPGVVYAGAALVAIVLHESLLASNPWTVVRLLIKGGVSSIKVAILLAVAVGLAAIAAVGLFRLPELGILATIVGVWLFWMIGLYGAMVVARVLGLYYHRNAKAVGWFKERPQWGAS